MKMERHRPGNNQIKFHVLMGEEQKHYWRRRQISENTYRNIVDARWPAQQIKLSVINKLANKTDTIKLNKNNIGSENYQRTTKHFLYKSAGFVSKK